MNSRPVLSRTRVRAVRSGLRRTIARIVVVALVALGFAGAGAVGTAASAAPAASVKSAALAAGGSALATVDTCGTAAQPIVCENALQGTSEDVWDAIGTGAQAAGDPDLQGFATNISLNVGDTVSFKIDDKTKKPYTVNIYRLGYYGGDGAALKASFSPTSVNAQPACLHYDATHLVDCGNWSTSASWAVPGNSVSGVYLARLTWNDGSNDGSQIPFIVRNDASHSDILFQTSDTTWQAYNNYGGNPTYDGDKWFDTGANLYGGPSYLNANRATKISYNRPFITRSWEDGRDYLFANEYPMIRFMEENGYDVSYFSGVDTSRFGNLLTNHKAFVTAGHDEYWDTVQRANVTAARNAGVNMAFFSGNDDYWKTRYENSTDGSNTPYRTEVTYKETWDNAKSDPTPTWTGTWRDPRFSPPADGNQPENSLGGTMFMSNITDMPVTVTQAQGKLRIWRNTGLSSMTGASTALAPHTVGYESNEDLDNGFRPAGLIDMSTVSGQVTAELKDYGTTTGAGTTTHHITLYKAPSGALVFSAGSIQWAMGLDDDHDYVQGTTSKQMQQATVNLFADMGVQPGSLATADLGLVGATRSTDTTAPVTTITSPGAGATIANGASVTVSGTATDSGGIVGGVEVSLDGGATWHPASGTSSWSYTGVAHGQGSVKIESRATDDSGNIETAHGNTVTESCPCGALAGVTPAVPDSGDTSTNVELGVKFKTTTDGQVTGVKFYKASANTGAHVGTLWSSTGQQLDTGTFSGETASGWQTLTFSQPYPVTAGTTYVISYTAPKGHYSADPLYFSALDQNPAGPVVIPRSTQASPNGVYGTGGQLPTSSYQDENYYVDPTFTPSSVAAPVVTNATPRSGQTGVATTGSTVTATFSTAVTGAEIALKTSSGASVSGTTTYDSASQTATFTPSTTLAAATAYTVTVSGAKAANGVTMTAYSWTFTTDSSASCPCSLFGNSTPGTADSGDSTPVEVGTKFTPSVNGTVTGVRFYKASANSGTHTGSLWSSSGTQLATGTFTGESASGWQTLTFASPVAVTAGTTYTASYYAPSGHYSADSNFFLSSYTSGSLTAPASNNGVYTYGTGGVAPTTSFQATSYWVDPLFISGTVAPTVSSTTPASGATNVSLAATPSATFSAPITASSLQFTLKTSDGTSVAGSAALSGNTATFTSSTSLSPATTYTATVSATSTGGTAMTAPYSWTFTTSAPVSCPCTLFGTSTPGTVDSGDTTPVNLGVKFTPSKAGYVTGVRFYKAAANTGTHTGTLWGPDGSQLATGTFANEGASGWQTLTFASPVAVTAGTTYTASYYDPNGHYSTNGNFFSSAYANGPLTAPATTNGVYAYGSAATTAPTASYQASNYWVDVTFTDSSAAPTVTSTTPTSNATNVGLAVAPSATFSLPVTSASLQFTLKTSGGAQVAGTAALSGQTATFTPSASLASGATYTATVQATSTGGAAMASAYSWSFSTSAATACPCTLFDTTTPGTVDSGDTSAVTLGVRVTPASNGFVTGIRFYKAAANTGTHIGYLWGPDGTQLATGTFTNESASGWQTLTFASPAAVTAGSTYTASYYDPSGHYSADGNFFGTPFANGPLTAPATTNGVYVYGTAAAMPTSSYLATNYWVDVTFNTSTATDTTPPAISAVTASGTGTTATVTWTTDESSTSSVAYGTSATSLTSSATGTSGTAHSVALSGLTAGTTYYYRVTSADAAGNSATSPDASGSPAQFTVASTAGSVTQTTLADFTGGSQSNTYVANRSGGEVTLSPTATTEFTGTAIPTGWAATSQATGSSIGYSSGGASISGQQLRTTATYTSTRQLDTMATLKQVDGQWLGLTNSTSFSGTTSTWAAFRTSSTGLVAEVHSSSATTDSAALSTSFLGSAHRFGVYWTSSQAVFTVDGATVATVARGATVSMFAAAMDTTVDANPLVITSAWVTPYASTGTFTSSVIDAGATRTWGTFTPTASSPANTTMTYQVRTGPSATAGGTGWTAWTNVTAGGTIGGSNRYLQYKAVLGTASTANAAPQLTQVVVAYT